MSWLESIILGLIQGLTEFIPVSSSGHLVIAQIFLSGASDHLFLQFIDIGTTIALIVFFRKKLWHIIKDVFVNRNYRLALNIIITAIPAGVVGLALSSLIEKSSFFGSIVVVATALTLVGIVMIIVDKLPHAKPVNKLENLPRRRALAIGIAQVFALIPGVSRSGSTIIAGRLAGFDAAQAAEYSFLVSIPIMFGVCLKTMVSDHAYLSAHLGTLFVSNLFAFIAGMFAVGFLMRYLARHSLAVFGWYRVILGVLILAVVLTTKIVVLQ
jgi:undecaprenyl-diphosphatase